MEGGSGGREGGREDGGRERGREGGALVGRWVSVAGREVMVDVLAGFSGGEVPGYELIGIIGHFLFTCALD